MNAESGKPQAACWAKAGEFLVNRVMRLTGDPAVQVAGKFGRDAVYIPELKS
jgi:hypothetical protein